MSRTIAGNASSIIQEVLGRILSVRTPQAVILFGSRARGDAGPRSDIDLLIVERENPLPRHQRATDYRLALWDIDIDCDIDILVYTPEEIEDWSEVPNAFPTTAIREGKVLYENPGGHGQRVAG
jgi:uncharacterized protein